MKVYATPANDMPIVRLHAAYVSRPLPRFVRRPSRATGRGFRPPEIRIIEYKTLGTERKLPPERAVRALIEIRRTTCARINLIEHLDCKLGKSHPRGSYRCAASDRKSQAAHRKKIGRGTESQVHVRTAPQFGRELAVCTPPQLRAAGELECCGYAAYMAVNSHLPRLPLGVTVDGVLEPTGSLPVYEERDTREQPAGVMRRKLGDLVSGKVEPTP